MAYAAAVCRLSRWFARAGYGARQQRRLYSTLLYNQARSISLEASFNQGPQPTLSERLTAAAPAGEDDAQGRRHRTKR